MHQVNVLILGQAGRHIFKERTRFLKMIAGLWKFRITIIEYDKLSSFRDLNQYTHLIICYEDSDPSFEEWCANQFEDAPAVETLLLDTTPKEYGPLMQAAFGVNGIKSYEATKKIPFVCNGDDPLLYGLERITMFRGYAGQSCGALVLNEAYSLLSDSKGTCFLSRLGSKVCFGINIWQVGVPTFPAVFAILQNYFFFAGGIGHFSPMPFVSLRIDDFPLTSEQYLNAGGVSDDDRFSEIDDLCTWSNQFNARLEFMITSKVMNAEGSKLRAIDEVVPKSAALLREYYEKGIININAHGRSHIDENLFEQTREISPLEFARLSERDTRDHLHDCIEFSKRFFAKIPNVFVPPCWGYNKGVTKKVCADFFTCVIDSAKNFRICTDCQGTGYVDDMGLLHLVETWHLGSQDFNHADPYLWKSFISCGIPIHMMSHGLYIYDPLPEGRIPRLLSLIFVILAMPLITLIHPNEVFSSIKSFNPFIRWNRLGILKKIITKLPYFKNASVYNLLMTGKKYGARWCFTEKLANHLREYNCLQIQSYLKKNGIHDLSFTLSSNIHGPFLFHLPGKIESATLDGASVSVLNAPSVLEIANLVKGTHSLIVRTA